MFGYFKLNLRKSHLKTRRLFEIRFKNIYRKSLFSLTKGFLRLNNEIVGFLLTLSKKYLKDKRYKFLCNKIWFGEMISIIDNRLFVPESFLICRGSTFHILSSMIFLIKFYQKIVLNYLFI